VQQVSLVVLSSCLAQSYWNTEGLVQIIPWREARNPKAPLRMATSQSASICEDPDRQNGCKSCSPGKTCSKERSITSFNARINFVAMQCTIALQAFQDLLSWKTSHIVIDALPAGALAWIAGNPAPAVGTLH
jgi:hypothetical protein